MQHPVKSWELWSGEEHSISHLPEVQAAVNQALICPLIPAVQKNFSLNIPTCDPAFLWMLLPVIPLFSFPQIQTWSGATMSSMSSSLRAGCTFSSSWATSWPPCCSSSCSSSSWSSSPASAGREVSSGKIGPVLPEGHPGMLFCKSFLQGAVLEAGIPSWKSRNLPSGEDLQGWLTKRFTGVV